MAQRFICCVCIKSSQGDERSFFVQKENFCIGRGEDADVQISSSSASRRHLMVRISGGDIWIQDTGSSNGTLLSGHSMQANSEVHYKPGEPIRIGRSQDVMTLELASYMSDVKASSSTGPMAIPHSPVSDEKTVADLIYPKIMEEAKKEADKLISAAKLASDQIRRDAQADSQRAVEKGEQQAEKVREKIRHEVDALMKSTMADALTLQTGTEEERGHLLKQAKEEGGRLIEAAREEASAIIADAQRMSPEIKKRVDEDGRRQAEKMVGEARQTAGRIKVEAQNQAEEILKAARLESTRVKISAEAQAETVLKTAEQKVEQLIRAKEAEMDRILNEAREGAAAIRKKARDEVEQIKKDARHQASTFLQNAQMKAVEMYNDAQARGNLFVTQKEAEGESILKEAAAHGKSMQEASMKESEKILAKARIEGEHLRDKITEDARRDQISLTQFSAALKNEILENQKAKDFLALENKKFSSGNETLRNRLLQAEELLRKSQAEIQKVREEEKLQTDKYQEKVRETGEAEAALAVLQTKVAEAEKGRVQVLLEAQTLKKKWISEISKDLQAYVLSKWDDSSTESSSPPKPRTLAAEIKDLVGKTINRELAEEETSKGSGRSPKMRRLMVGGFATAALAGGIFVWQSKGGLPWSEGASVLPLSRVLLQMPSQVRGETPPRTPASVEPQRSVAPPSLFTDSFKDSYVENVLHTTDYLDLKLDHQAQKQWGTELNKFFTEEMFMDDDTADKIITIESDLIRQLKNLRDESEPGDEKIHLKKMVAAEKASAAKMKNILGGESNFSQFRDFEKNYFMKVRSATRAAPGKHGDGE